MPYIGKIPAIGNYQVLDAITATTTDTYALTKNSVAVFPQTPANCIVSLNGVIQAPFSSYTISGSNIVFASALTGSDSIDFITVLGDVLNVGTVSDGTIGLAKLSATGTKDATTFLRGDNTFASAGGTNTPAFMAYLSADQTVSDNTITKVQCNTEIFDTNSAYDNSTNYRFTVPSGQGGKYVVFGAVQSNSANDQFNTSVYIYVNGSVYAGNTINFYNTTGSEASPYIQYIVNLSAGDYLELFGRCDTASGSSVAFYYSSAHSQAKSTYFGAYKIIE